jgi:hypothetical protein
VHRHAGLTEEFDELGITPGDPGDVPLDCYPPAPGGGGRMHDYRCGFHTANGAMDRRSRARGLRWERCAVRVTGHINSDARPHRDRYRGTACPGAWRPAAAPGHPGRTPPCTLSTKRVRLRIQLPGPPHHLVARQAACTAQFSRAEPLCGTNARARRALPLSRSADCAPLMRGCCGVGRCGVGGGPPQPDRLRCCSAGQVVGRCPGGSLFRGQREGAVERAVRQERNSPRKHDSCACGSRRAS